MTERLKEAIRNYGKARVREDRAYHVYNKAPQKEHKAALNQYEFYQQQSEEALEAIGVIIGEEQETLQEEIADDLLVVLDKSYCEPDDDQGLRDTLEPIVRRLGGEWDPNKIDCAMMFAHDTEGVDDVCDGNEIYPGEENEAD